MKELYIIFISSILLVGQSYSMDSSQNPSQNSGHKSRWEPCGRVIKWVGPSCKVIAGVSFLAGSYVSWQAGNGMLGLSGALLKDKTSSPANEAVKGFMGLIPAIGSTGFYGMAIIGGAAGTYLTLSGGKKLLKMCKK